MLLSSRGPGPLPRPATPVTHVIVIPRSRPTPPLGHPCDGTMWVAGRGSGPGPRNDTDFVGPVRINDRSYGPAAGTSLPVGGTLREDAVEGGEAGGDAAVQAVRRIAAVGVGDAGRQPGQELKRIGDVVDAP